MGGIEISPVTPLSQARFAEQRRTSHKGGLAYPSPEMYIRPGRGTFGEGASADLQPQSENSGVWVREMALPASGTKKEAKKACGGTGGHGPLYLTPTTLLLSIWQACRRTLPSRASPKGYPYPLSCGCPTK